MITEILLENLDAIKKNTSWDVTESVFVAYWIYSIYGILGPVLVSQDLTVNAYSHFHRKNPQHNVNNTEERSKQVIFLGTYTS